MEKKKELTVYYGENESKRVEYNSIRFVPTIEVLDDMPESVAEGVRSYNRANLAKGVKGVKCIHSGKVMFTLPDDEELDMPDYFLNYRVSSGELYENGAVNLYCRMRSDNKLIGYILVR